jgi:protein disulfide-isomerase-like protein
MKFLALALLSLVSAEVVNLTGDNFAESIADGNNWFIKYYAPWCGHCKKLAPTWDELSGSSELPDNVRVAHVDCTQQQDICTQQDIKGYPTLKFHKAGSTEGERYQVRARPPTRPPPLPLYARRPPLPLPPPPPPPQCLRRHHPLRCHPAGLSRAERAAVLCVPVNFSAGNERKTTKTLSHYRVVPPPPSPATCACSQSTRQTCARKRNRGRG